MKLGAYTAVLHDKPLPEALAVLREMGLESAEINSGGFLPPVHLPVDDIRSSAGAREDYLGLFTEAGMTLTALNCNGNPPHPDPEVRDKHSQDVRDAIELLLRAYRCRGGRATTHGRPVFVGPGDGDLAPFQPGVGMAKGYHDLRLSSPGTSRARLPRAVVRNRAARRRRRRRHAGRLGCLGGERLGQDAARSGPSALS